MVLLFGFDLFITLKYPSCQVILIAGHLTQPFLAKTLLVHSTRHPSGLE